jgi:PAP2 superfamily
MLEWIAASIAFFLYVMVAAPLVRGLQARRRRLATAGSAAGLVIALAAHVQPHTAVLHDWIVPPALLLLAYWSSGLLFAAPMPRAECALVQLDRVLAIDRAAAAMPRWAAELLELAYISVYPLIPVALAIHLFATAAPDPERFWTVILVTDFVCFAFLPWIQTRPPRAVLTPDPWIARLRRINLRVLGRTSIQVNTFPSGHAAEALAAALLVIGAPWPWVVYVAINAALISAGAVFGRYHYAADAIAGWMVALGVWAALG